MADSLDPKSIDKATSATEKQTSAIKRQTSEMEKLEAAKKKFLKALGVEKEEWEDINKKTDTYITSQKKLGKVLDSFESNLEDINGVLKTSVTNMSSLQKKVKSLHLNRVFDAKKAKEYQGKLKEINKLMMAQRKIDQAAKKSGKFNADASLKNWERITKRQQKIKDRMEDAEAVSKGGGRVAGIAKTISAAPDIMSVLGNAAKGLGGMLGKLIPGWAMVGLTAVKALYDMGLAADEFVKNANKAFASVRGPDIMTSDIKRQFKDFNDQIFKAGENIRVGLNVTQIRELMHAMAGAGLNITTLNKGLSNYRDAIYMASKASKTLGVELPAVGNMMATMINNFRMNMDKVDQSFVQIAFDAKKSGLTTDVFWTTVQNANASLALYGVAIKSASKTLTAFTENAVGGADDAAEATQDMFNVFKSGTLSTQAAFLQFATQGGANLKKMLGDQVKDLQAAQSSIKDQILKITVKGKPTTGSPEEEQLVKLRKELYSNQTKIDRFNAVMSSNAVEMTTEMGAFAKDAPELVMNVIKGMVPVGEDISKLSKNSLIVAQQAAETAGFSGKTVKMLVELATDTKQKLKDIATRVSESKDGINALSDDEKDYLRGSSEAITKALDENNKEALVALLTGPENAAKSINAVTTKQFKINEKSDEILASNAEDTFKGIVDQTLSYKEMIDIAKDEVQWRANSLNVLQAMDDGIFSIFKWLTKKVSGGAQTEGEKRAQAALLGTGKFKTKGGRISQEDQTSGIINTVKGVSALTAGLRARAAFSEVLKPGVDTAKATQATLGSYDRVSKGTQDPKVQARIKLEKKAFEALILAKQQSKMSNSDFLNYNEEQSKIETDQLNTANESLQNLVQLNRSNASTLELARKKEELSPEDFKKYINETVSKEGAFASEMLGAMSFYERPKASETPIYGGAFHATGTKYAQNIPTLVGENGPEWMVPNRGAQIFPHGILPPAADLAGGVAGAGKGTTNEFSITINASANPQQIANVVQSTLNKMNIGG